MDREYVKFIEELGLEVGLVSRYGGLLMIYTDGTSVKVLFAKDEKYLKEALKKIKKEIVWLDEELLQKEMLQNAPNIEGDVEP